MYIFIIKNKDFFILNMETGRFLIHRLPAINNIKKNFVSLNQRKHYKMFSLNSFMLILHITDKCNLDCRYCYLRSYKPKNTITMSQEIAIKTIETVLNFPFKNFFIEFHGGEPLLEWPLIKEVIYYINRKIERTGKSIFWGIQTNGTILDVPFYEFADKKINIGVSIDGPEYIHNRARIKSDGGGSFAQVIHFIKMLKKHTVSFTTKTVIIDPEYTLKIFHFLKNIGVYRMNFAPLIINNKNKNISQYFDDFTLNLLQIGKEVISHNKTSINSYITEYTISVYLKDFLGYKNYDFCHPCQAGVNLISVDPSGYIFPCEEFLNLFKLYPELSFANLNILDPLKYEIIMKNLNYIKKTIKIETPCSTCIWRTICNGLCPVESYYIMNLLGKNNVCLLPHFMYNKIAKLLIDVKEDLKFLVKYNKGRE